MEGLRLDSLACRYIASQLAGVPFTVVDVGCSRGIGRIWRLFGNQLRAYGFDPDINECTRLNAVETLPGVHYVPAFVGLPQDHPVALRRGGKPYVQRSPWWRFSIARSRAIQNKLNPPTTDEELTARNLWQQTALADPDNPVYLPDFFRDHAIVDIDFIKIDVDGPDFDILQTLSDSLMKLNVLAVGLEVNFVGSPDETDHTFHNTDRFMRRLEFELAYLVVKPYSLAALPARYAGDIPAEAVSGRPFQGDALYVRDFGDPDQAAGRDFPAAKMAKLASIFAAFGLYDCAAEVVLTHRHRLAALLDPDGLLDLLCTEAQGDQEPKLSYPDYIAAFEQDDPRFYSRLSGADHGSPSLPAASRERALRRAWRTLPSWLQRPMRRALHMLPIPRAPAKPRQ
jgi:Methyltransferase FkbM domain